MIWKIINKVVRRNFFILICFFFATALFSLTLERNIPLKNISFNRVGKVLSKKELEKYPFSTFAFRWNDKDAKTLKWRPQGITKIKFGKDKEYLAVSWYGRKKMHYENRGVRISFVDITNKNFIKYRHVLLVDKEYNTYNKMHGGGIVYINNTLHVADSRHGKKEIHVFSLDNIKIVPKKLRKHFFGYKYILQEKYTYSVPIKPSFMSFDFSTKKILIGSFHRCKTDGREAFSCILDKNNRLSWYTLADINHKIEYSFPYFSEMQGAVSVKGISSFKDTFLLVASSYGKNRSKLHIVNIPSAGPYNNGKGMYNYRVVKFPPGLEDMCVTHDSKELWLLTEFGPYDYNKANNRVVFSVSLNDLLKSLY